jgi:hypothetical protein
MERKFWEVNKEKIIHFAGFLFSLIFMFLFTVNCLTFLKMKAFGNLQNSFRKECGWFEAFSWFVF